MVVVERHDGGGGGGGFEGEGKRIKEAEVRAKEVKTEEEAESQWRNAVGSGVREEGGEVIFYVKGESSYLNGEGS